MKFFKKISIVFAVYFISDGIYPLPERPLVFRNGRAVSISTRTMHRILWFTFNSEVRESEICLGTGSLLFMDKDLNYAWQNVLPLITFMIYSMDTVNFYCGESEWK